MTDVVIVGAGPAGVTVAETLRSEGSRARITMLSLEPFPPYSPPAMADYFLEGGEDNLFWKGKDVCERLDVEYRPETRAVGLAPEERLLRLEGGEELAYDRLVVATGGRLYANVEGVELPGVHDFKSLSAAESLVGAAGTEGARSAAIVGAGFIGVEIAMLLRGLGLEVKIVEMEDRVMPRMLDAETAGIVREALEEEGVAVDLGMKAERFLGRERAEAVELADGRTEEADLFVAATGVKPHVGFLEGSGVEVDWGVVVDDRLRTTREDVYAAGDVAETVDRLTGERYVHAIFPNAVEHGRTVAHNLMGADRAYPGSESMNSLKHVGIPVIAMGHRRGDRQLRRRSGRNLRKIFLEDGRIAGFQLAGDIRGAGVLRSLMLRRRDVSDLGDRLLDPELGIADLVLPPMRTAP